MWRKVKARKQLKHIPEKYVDIYTDWNAKVSDNTLAEKKKQWIKNLKINAEKWDFFKHNAHELKEKGLKGETVYLVGASPSLKKNIKHLRGKKNIWACAHVLKYLLSHGIKPDYVFVADSRHESVKFLNTVKSKGLTLVAEICVSPKIWDVWKGDVLFYKGVIGEEMNREVEKVTKFNNTVSSGGSVMGIMTVIAWSVKAKKIVYIGNDLSYPDGLPYPAERNIVQNIIPDEEADYRWMYDIAGRKIDTLVRMFLYKMFLDICSQMAKGIKFINATEGGILGAYAEGNIKSMKQMQLKEV
jgi:hypothetical protein